MRKKQCLLTLALVSPRRNRRSRAQTSKFTIENQHVLVQMAPRASWPPDVPAESLEARSPQPGFLSQESSAKIPQPENLSQESSANSAQPSVCSQDSSARNPASSLQPICLGAALESYVWVPAGVTHQGSPRSGQSRQVARTFLYIHPHQG